MKKQFFYINIFLSEPPLIKPPPPSPPPHPPPLLILDTFVGTRATIWNPFTYLALNTMFFKIGVFLVITGWGEKKQNVRFLISCAGVAVCGRLLVVSVCLLLICSRILLVCGHLWSFVVVCWWFVNICWWFVVVCGGLYSFVPSAPFRYKRQAKKRPWNTSHT